MKYDFVFLLNEEEEAKNLKDIIKSLSGKVVNEESLGKKTLAYPIKKQNSANFYSWKIEFERNKLEEFKKKLSFNEKLMRYLLLKED